MWGPVTYPTSTEGGGLLPEVSGQHAPNTRIVAELAAEQEGGAEPEMGIAEASFPAWQIAGACSTVRELAAAAHVGAERREWSRRQWEAAGTELKRKTEFAALSMGS